MDNLWLYEVKMVAESSVVRSNMVAESSVVRS